MRLRLALVLIVLAVPAVGCSGSDSDGVARPAWVEVGVSELRSKFEGNPEPVAVTWGDTADRRWVVVRFAKAYRCTACSSPQGAPSRSNGARIEFAPGTTKMVSFNTESH